MTIKRRLAVLECYVSQRQAEPARLELDQLDQDIGAMSQAERIAFVEEWRAGSDEALLDFLTDWRDFLKLQGNPATVPNWNNDRRHFEYTEVSQKWSDIHRRRWQWAGWTGKGLPPELREQ